MPDDFVERHSTQLEAIAKLRGAAQLQLLQTNLDIAISQKHVDDIIEWADRLMETANRCGWFDAQLQTFQTLVNLYSNDRAFDPLREEALWYYKWIAARLVEYVDVSREQIEQFFLKMETFYTGELESLAPVYKLRMWTADVMNERELAATWFEKWKEAPEGKSNDCPACLAGAVVEHLLAADKVDAAIAAADPIFRGRMRCRTVPASTFSIMLMPLLFTGRGEWAARLQRAVFRQVRTWPVLADSLARHVMFLSLTGQSKWARRPVIVLLHRLSEPLSDHIQFVIWRSLWIWSVTLAKEQVLRVRLSNNFISGGMIDVSEFTTRCQTECQERARAFDARNGNTGYADAMMRLAEFCEAIMKSDDR